MLGCIKNGFRTRVSSILNYETGLWSRFEGISVPFLLPSFCLGKRPFSDTLPFSHKITRSDFIAGFGALIVRRRQYITSLSWCPETADMGKGQDCLKTPPISPIRAKRPVNQWLGLYEVQNNHVSLPY